VGDEYVSRHPKFGPWRDTHVKLEDSVVKYVQFCFTQDWYWATTRISDLKWELKKAENGCEKTLLIASGPADAFDTCRLMFVHAIHMARELLWIASPYFVSDTQVLSALKLAVRSARLLSPIL
jgi:cardiolipin synthase